MTNIDRRSLLRAAICAPVAAALPKIPVAPQLTCRKLSLSIFATQEMLDDCLVDIEYLKSGIKVTWKHGEEELRRKFGQ